MAKRRQRVVRVNLSDLPNAERNADWIKYARPVGTAVDREASKAVEDKALDDARRVGKLV